MSDQRGFTLIELAMVLVIASLITPITWLWFTQHEDQARLTAWELDIARAVPVVGEELREDAWRGVPVGGEPVAFRRATCTVTYEIRDEALVRRAEPACGGTRALATHVESLVAVDGGVELTFRRSLRPDRAARRVVFLPWGTP